MAKVEIKYQPTQHVDTWDQVKKVTLELTREEAKVVQALVAKVSIGVSGPAGTAAQRVYDTLQKVAPYEENNLYLNGGNVIIHSK